MLSAIIVAYKTPAELAAAVASLHAQQMVPDEIIVVDNGAADGAAIPESADFRDVRIEQSPTNVGYGAGCNLAARSAAGDRLLVMNADVVLTAEASEAMVRRLDQDGQVGVVGPQILSGGRLQSSARSWPSLRTGLFGRRSLATRLLMRAGHYPAELRPTHSGGHNVDWVSGACMLLRTSAFWQVGGFDEGYWMYWEDADLCRRLEHSGWKVAYEPNAVVHHATGASGTSERTIRAFHESAARFAARHMARNSVQRRFVTALLRLRANMILRTWALRNKRV